MKTCIKNLRPLFQIILSLTLVCPVSWAQSSKTTLTKSNADKAMMIDNLNKIAELEFLEGDLSKAQNTYKQITDLALDESWSDETRKIMFQSFFRLAQIDKGHEKEWTTKAFVFASDLEPNIKTTPQTLIKLYSQAKVSDQVVTLNESDLENTNLKGKHLEQKIINGSKTLNTVYKNKIYRLDLLTGDQKSSTHFVRGDLIANFKPHKPKVENKTVASTSKVLAETLPTKTLKTINYTQSLSEGFGENKNNTLDFQNAAGSSTAKVKSSKRRRTWIYIASTALAVTLGAVLISNNNDKSNSYDSARNQGF